MGFEDNVLIKLKRDYSKDESIAFLIRRISELKLEKGKTDSYIQELKHEIKVLKNDIKHKVKVVTNDHNLIRKIEKMKLKDKEKSRKINYLIESNKAMKEKLNI